MFSGIGGFALGAHWAGLSFDKHYFSEVDPYAIRVYSARFPEAEALGDIRAIRGADLPHGDWIIAGGFPCQDISIAGKGAGLAGERSGLWYEYARIIGELRPRYAIMENVGALAFRGLDSVLGSLSALWYDAEWQDIRASDVGAPHRRERLWIVAYPEQRKGGERYQPSMLGRRKREAEQTRLGGSGSDVPDALGNGIRHESGRGDGQDGTDSPEPRDDGAEGAVADSENQGHVRRDGQLGATQSEVRGHHGSPADGRREWWAAEPDMVRVAHGVPARVDRLKCLGNSIVPQIAEIIFAQPAFDEWRDE